MTDTSAVDKARTMDPKMLAAIQTKSMEQRSLEALERIEVLLQSIEQNTRPQHKTSKSRS